MLPIHANYFNSKLATWEPLVEQWSVGVKLVQTPDGAEVTPKLAVDLMATTPLLVNASHAFLTMIGSTVVAWQRDLEVRMRTCRCWAGSR